MMGYYDRYGKQITSQEWIDLMSDDEYREVGRKVFPDGTLVSTVWLGINHSFSGLAIFETMVFDLPGQGDTELQWRYGDVLTATGWHEVICSAVESGVTAEALESFARP